MLFWRRWFFFHWLFEDIDVESASKQIAGKHRILTTIYISGSCVIHTVIVLWLPFPTFWPLQIISKSSQNWRQDLFQKWKLYRRTQRPSWLLSISRVIRILMKVIRLTNGKLFRCYNTCVIWFLWHGLFHWTTWRHVIKVISLQEHAYYLTALWYTLSCWKHKNFTQNITNLPLHMEIGWAGRGWGSQLFSPYTIIM